jgi:hypothetical protein
MALPRIVRVSAYAVLVLALMTLPACAAYVTPGRGADMSAFGMSQGNRELLTDSAVQNKLDLKPLARFPTGLAVVRVQAPGYSSYTCANSYGSGRYSIVTTRDVESDQAIAQLGNLPLVTGVAPVNRLLLPEQLESDKEIRQAAAALHADLVLIYTFDTAFQSTNGSTTLAVVSLGLFPTEVSRVTTTASAVLLDTRNGYVYAVAEATAQDDTFSSPWASEDAVDSVRRRTERQAFDKLIADFHRAWAGVINTYALQAPPNHG